MYCRMFLLSCVNQEWTLHVIELTIESLDSPGLTNHSTLPASGYLFMVFVEMKNNIIHRF